MTLLACMVPLRRALAVDPGDGMVRVRTSALVGLFVNVRLDQTQTFRLSPLKDHVHI